MADFLGMATSVPAFEKLFDLLNEDDAFDPDSTEGKAVIKAFKRSGEAQALLWLSNGELSLRYEDVGDFYKIIFGKTKPSPEHINKVIKKALK